MHMGLNSLGHSTTTRAPLTGDETAEELRARYVQASIDLAAHTTAHWFAHDEVPEWAVDDLNEWVDALNAMSEADVTFA